MAQDETRHDHPTTRRTSSRLSVLVPFTALALVAVLTGIFLTRSLAAPRPSSHSTAVPLASPALQCFVTHDYATLPPYTLAGLKHESDIAVLGVVTGPANSSATHSTKASPFAEWSISLITVVYDRRQALTNTQTIVVRQDDGSGNDGYCRNVDDPLITAGERAFFFLRDGGPAALTGVSISGPAPYYHEVFSGNGFFPSVNGLISRNTTGSIRFDKPPTEASFIAQVRAANP
ncbi:MAG: hypothetical protein ACXVCO_13150 [Ktedonobacterales bacterium]